MPKAAKQNITVQTRVSPDPILTIANNREAEAARRREHHCDVYLQMDDPLHDAARMAEVVTHLVNADDEGNVELTTWAVNHLCDMVIKLYCLYDSEPADGAA
jgi:hypothetical protein